MATTEEEAVGDARREERKWGRNMTCYVTNQTGVLADVYAWHKWDGKRQDGQGTPLSPGQSFSFGIEVGSGGHDLWSLRYDTSDSPPRSRNRSDKQCDVTHGDLSSGGSVYINVGWDNFSVVLPDSSSCNENSYA